MHSGARACDGRSDGLPSAAQESGRRAPSKPPDVLGVTSAVADVSEDYRINPGDVIDIQVDRAPELFGSATRHRFRNDQDGVSGPVTAHGKTADELAGFIADSLHGRYLKIRA